MKGSTKNVVIIILLILMITLLGGLGFLFATNRLKIVPTEDDVVDKENQPNKTENDSDKNNLTDAQKIYSSVIEEYQKAMMDAIENQENWEPKYKYVNINTIHNYLNQLDNESHFKLNYSFYDINKDGVKEMLITESIVDIFSFDGTNIIRLFAEISSCLGYRCGLSIYDNGIIHFTGSGGAAYHYDSFHTINNNISTLKTINSYYEVYEDDGNGNTKVSIYNNDDYDENSNNNKKLDFNSVEEAISSNIGSSSKIDLTKLEWINFN